MDRCAPVAIILARGGSKGIPRKNLQKINGLSLVARSVRAARNASRLGDVWVSTDDDEIAKDARRYGARVIERPAEISTDGASSEAGWLHALDIIQSSGYKPDALVFLQCTSPFTTGGDIDACLARLTDTGSASVLSVIPDHGFLWRQDANGRAEGVNHAHLEPRQRRQDLTPSYLENGAIYCVRTAEFEKTRSRFAPPVALYPVDHPKLEIDDAADLDLARVIARSRDVTREFRSSLDGLNALVMDFDGVHTDDLVHTTETGAEVVVTSRSDGMGLSLLRQHCPDLRLLILSKERNAVVQARAKKLGIPALNAVDDKMTALGDWLEREGLLWEQTAYVGNDVNDLEVIGRAGFTACPSDARPEVQASVDWVLPAPGGKGALRALCDAIIGATR